MSRSQSIPVSSATARNVRGEGIRRRRQCKGIDHTHGDGKEPEQRSGTGGIGRPTAPTERTAPATEAPVGVPNGINAPTTEERSTTAAPHLAVAFEQNKKASVKAKYGRIIVVRGRLTDGAGAPIGGAQIDYSALVTRAGARRQDLGSVRTDSTGASS